MGPFPTFCSHFHTKIGDKYKILEFSHGQDGQKITFSIAKNAESSAAASGDLIEYFGSGIVNRSITPIFSQNLPLFYWAST